MLLLLLFSSFMSGCPAGGFFLLFYSHMCCVMLLPPLWRVCLHGFGYFFPFLFGLFLAMEKPEGKSQFFWCVLWLVFFVLDFISALRYVTFVGHECVECEF